jgi:hypothetical protein
VGAGTRPAATRRRRRRDRDVPGRSSARIAPLTALHFGDEDQTIHHGPSRPSMAFEALRLLPVEGTKITKKSDLNILRCLSAAATELNLLDANFGSLFFVFFVFFVPSW